MLSLIKLGVENKAGFEDDFATQHEFYDALPTAFGDTEDAEFDWNVCLAVLWITGLRPTVQETEAGWVLTWKPSHGYQKTLTFKQAYMDASVELQKLFWGEAAYCQVSWLSILDKLAKEFRVWRSDIAHEYTFVLEYGKK